MSTYYRRHLPHWQPAGKVFFVTFRLHGSLPRKVIERLEAEAEAIRNQPLRPGETPSQKDIDDAKRVFALFEKALDETMQQPSSDSPRWLADAGVAKLVQDAIQHRDGKVLRLHRYVIMPNHVHILIEPLPEELQTGSDIQSSGEQEVPYHALEKILHGLKMYTARQAHGILGRAGAFWQDESYDHWVRSDKEYDRIIHYIDQNPVVAGLCAKPADWPWSSAGEKVGRVA